jgi:hypothetical protein
MWQVVRTQRLGQYVNILYKKEKAGAFRKTSAIFETLEISRVWLV